MSEDDTAPLKTSRRRRTMSGKRRAVLSDSDEDHELSQISDVKHRAYNFRGRDKQPSYNKGSARAVAKMSLEKQLISSSDDELPKKTHRRTTRPALTLDSDTTPESESENWDSVVSPPLSVHLRDRRKISSSSKKQKLMELKRLQRIRKRQGDKRAEKEQIHQNEKSQNTSTSQILPSSRKNILTQQDNQCSTLNACKPIDKDNVRSRCITQKTLDGSLSKDAVSRIPSITDDLDSNDDPTSDAQLVDVLDCISEMNTCVLTGTLVSENVIDLCESYASKQLVNTDSSDSDVVSSRTRKRVKKILVDTDDEEENVTHEERDISENEPENQSDDDDDDMSGFIVDDNEDLENVAISDGDDNLELESEDGEYEEKYVEMDDDEYQLKNFVVEKKLLSSEKVISSVWKREGELLHQYKRQETDCHGDDLDDGDEELDIFERTDETADYRTKGRNQYRPITVQWLHDKEREENTAIQVISWDPPISVEVTDELLPEMMTIFARGLKEVFEIYLQALLSTVIDPDFLVSVYEEQDPYFVPALRKVDAKLEDQKYFLVKSGAWRPYYKKVIEKYHVMDFDEFSSAGGGCEACILTNRIASYDVTFSGDPYNPLTLEILESDSEDERDADVNTDDENEDDLSFSIGRYCCKRSELYHSLHHFKFHMYQDCRKQVEYIRLIKHKVRDDEVIQICMEDNNWIERRFSLLEDLMDNACKYTSDGKHLAR